MKRVASVIGLPPESVERYEELHAAVWPAVLEQIAASNIANYSIYRYGELLFSYFEYTGDDYAADSAAIAADATTRQWWTLTDPCQVRLPGTPDGEQWATMTEVWHLD